MKGRQFSLARLLLLQLRTLVSLLTAVMPAACTWEVPGQYAVFKIPGNGPWTRADGGSIWEIVISGSAKPQKIEARSGDLIGLSWLWDLDGSWLLLRPVISGDWGERYGPAWGWVGGMDVIPYEESSNTLSRLSGDRELPCDRFVELRPDRAGGAVALLLTTIGNRSESWRGFNIPRLYSVVLDKSLSDDSLDFKKIHEHLADLTFGMRSVTEKSICKIDLDIPPGIWTKLDGRPIDASSGTLYLYEGINTWVRANGTGILDFNLTGSCEGTITVTLLHLGN